MCISPSPGSGASKPSTHLVFFHESQEGRSDRSLKLLFLVALLAKLSSLHHRPECCRRWKESAARKGMDSVRVLLCCVYLRPREKSKQRATSTAGLLHRACYTALFDCTSGGIASLHGNRFGCILNIPMDVSMGIPMSAATDTPTHTPSLRLLRRCRGKIFCQAPEDLVRDLCTTQPRALFAAAKTSKVPRQFREGPNTSNRTPERRTDKRVPLLIHGGRGGRGHLLPRDTPGVNLAEVNGRTCCSSASC